MGPTDGSSILPARRETYRRSSRVVAALLGGAVPGWLVGVLPHLPLGGASELLNSRAYLLETVFLVLARIFPVAVLRWLRGPFALPFLFTVAGAVFGLGSFLLVRRAVEPRRRFIAALSTSAGFLLFLLLGPVIKALFFYPARAMLSFKGALLIGGALLISVLAGVLLYFPFKASRSFGVIVPALIVLLSAALAIVPGRSGPPEGSGFLPRRVVLIGVDAASWNALQALVRQGRLPHLESLIRTGARGTLRATLPVRSPAIWTSIVTGQGPDRHGVGGYVVRDPETGELLPMSIAMRHSPALWDITSRAGLETDVVAWYGAWPAEKVGGVFLSERLGFRGLERRAEPPEETDEFEALVPPTEGTSFPPAGLAEIARRLLGRGAPELFLIHFGGLDAVQHRFWASFDVRRGSPLATFLFSRPPAAVFDAEAGRVEEAYIEVDRALGVILEAAGEDAACFLVSGHGMGPAHGPLTFSLTEVLERLGWMTFKPGTREVDWSLTKLFDGTRDLKARELPRELVPNVLPQSPLREPGAAGGPAGLGDFMSQAARTLAGIRTAKGRAFFTKVRLVPARVSGPPRLDVWVDLNLDADDELLVGGTRLPAAAVVDKARQTGMHRVEGVFLARGPGVRRGVRLADAGIMDIAPTILYFLDLPLGRDMTGRVLKEALDPRLLAVRSVKWVASHGSALESEPEDKLLDDLRSLGYIRRR